MAQLAQLLNPIVTLAVGSAAYILYRIQKGDAKRDAANIILLELKNAERNLEEVRKSYEIEKSKNSPILNFPEKIRLMPTESWTKYKYLFIRDMAPEQWDMIGKFYENCKLYDEAVEYKESSFKFNAAEIRSNIYRIAGDFAKELSYEVKPNPTNDPSIEKENNVASNLIKSRKDISVKAMTGLLLEAYGPDKPYNDAAYYYNLLPQTIVNTPTGELVIKLAARRKLLFWRSNN